MHAGSVESRLEVRCNQNAQVVCVEHGVFGRFPDALLAKSKNIRIRAQNDKEVAVKRFDFPDAVGAVLEEIFAAFYAYGRVRQKFRKFFLATDCARAGTAAAVRGRKGFVQIKMHHVEPQITGADNSHNGIKVCAVVVHETARLVDNRSNFQNMFVQKPEGIRIREHQRRRVFADRFFQCFEIHVAALIAFHVDDFKAAHCRACGVCAVSAVRHDNLVAL